MAICPVRISDSLLPYLGADVLRHGGGALIELLDGGLKAVLLHLFSPVGDAE